MEYIICSAIWFDNGEIYPHQPKNIETGFVIAGRRHHNCFATLAATSHMDFNKLDFEKEQGFITNTDRFVDRGEGLEIALAADQVLDIDKIRGKKLHSEDLY